MSEAKELVPPFVKKSPTSGMSVNKSLTKSVSPNVSDMPENMSVNAMLIP
jgi:hypothetical protein